MLREGPDSPTWELFQKELKYLHSTKRIDNMRGIHALLLTVWDTTPAHQHAEAGRLPKVDYDSTFWIAFAKNLVRARSTGTTES